MAPFDVHEDETGMWIELEGGRRIAMGNRDTQRVYDTPAQIDPAVPGTGRVLTMADMDEAARLVDGSDPVPVITSGHARAEALRRIGTSPPFTITGELIYGTYDDLLEAALGDAWEPSPPPRRPDHATDALAYMSLEDLSRYARGFNGRSRQAPVGMIAPTIERALVNAGGVPDTVVSTRTYNNILNGGGRNDREPAPRGDLFWIMNDPPGTPEFLDISNNIRSFRITMPSVQYTAAVVTKPAPAPAETYDDDQPIDAVAAPCQTIAVGVFVTIDDEED